jgi:transcriptional regulator with XRE-family HTH domain
VGDKQTPEQQAGQRIKHWRGVRQLSQEQVAAEMRKLGHPWHQTTVVKTEAAGRPLRLNEMTDLAAILGVVVFDLMGHQEYPAAAMLQLFRAEEDVERLQGHVDKLQRELEIAVSELQQAQQHEAEARERVKAETGLVEVDGEWVEWQTTHGLVKVNDYEWQYPEATDG